MLDDACWYEGTLFDGGMFANMYRHDWFLGGKGRKRRRLVVVAAAAESQ